MIESNDDEGEDMRTKFWLGVVSLIGAAACSSGNGVGGGGNTTSATTGTGGTTGAGGTTATGGAATATSVNGCEASTAEDHTKENPVMIMFGGSAGDAYMPSCAKIAKGSGVMFMGDLATLPLAGGVNGTKDATSPIKATSKGMMAMFDNLAAGTYGYFCPTKDAAGMHGAIFVE